MGKIWEVFAGRRQGGIYGLNFGGSSNPITTLNDTLTSGPATFIDPITSGTTATARGLIEGRGLQDFGEVSKEGLEFASLDTIFNPIKEHISGPGGSSGEINTQDTVDPVAAEEAKQREEAMARFYELLMGPNNINDRHFNNPIFGSGEGDARVPGIWEDIRNRADATAGYDKNYEALYGKTGESADKIGTIAAAQDGIISGIGARAEDVRRIAGQQTGIISGIGARAEDVRGIAGQQTDLINRMGRGAEDVGGIADALRAIGSGQRTDPRFEAYHNAQLSAMRNAQQNQQRQQSDFFGRRGMAGSSAALNQQNKMASTFGEQESLLAASLGMQNLQRQDQSLLNAANLYGQRGNMYGQQQSAYANQANMYGQSAGLLGQQSAASVNQANMYGQSAGLLGQQQTAYGNQANMYGQQAGLYGQQANIQNARGANMAQAAQMSALAGDVYGQGLDMQNRGMTNLLAPEAMAIARTAAENAGLSVDSGGGGKK